MLLARGDWSVFVTRPISLVFMVATALILVAMVVPALRGRASANGDAAADERR